MWAPSKRLIRATASSASALLLILAAGSIAAARTQVTLEVDGVSQPVVVWGGTVSTVLAQAGVEPGMHDLVQPERARMVTDGATVVVRTAHPYNLTINGRHRTVWSTSTSADAVLADTAHMGSSVLLAADRSSARGSAFALVSRAKPVIVLADGKHTRLQARPGDDVDSLLARTGTTPSPNDRVSFAAGTDGILRVIVTRVTRGESTETVAVPFSQREEESADLFLGESRIVQRGVAGAAVRTQWRETVGDTHTAQATTFETLTLAPIEQIRHTGTKDVTPLALLKAGVDPKAQLESGVDAYGAPFTAYLAPIGSLSSAEDIQSLINSISDPDERTQAAAQALKAGIDITYTGQDPKEIARIKVAALGWDDEQFACLEKLWTKESHWNPYAENPSSGAYGIPQALPGSKMASAGSDWQTNPATQITWGLGYIAARYDTPCSAWGHSTATGWY